jgi:hypothetical protein
MRKVRVSEKINGLEMRLKGEFDSKFDALEKSLAERSQDNKQRLMLIDALIVGALFFSLMTRVSGCVRLAF